MRACACACALVVVLAACGSTNAPQNVTIAPIASAPSDDAGASVSADASYTTNAQSEFNAAEALQRDGRRAEARDAFERVLRRYPYSRLAKEAELRIAQLDDSPDELHAWAKNHPSDERAAQILASLSRVGDVTCHVDADCAVTDKKDCCDCCPNGPYATSKKWLAWRDGQCAATRCLACPKKCAPAEPLPRAVCQQDKCAILP